MIIYISIIFAAILQMLPIATHYAFLKPDLVVLMLIFWLIYTPHRLGPYAIFFLGLVCDVAYGSTLGEHSFSFLIVSYLVYKLLRPLRVWPIWQQFGLVLLILWSNHLSYLLLKLAQGYDYANIHGFWITPLIGLVFWPLIRNLMFNLTPRASR